MNDEQLKALYARAMAIRAEGKRPCEVSLEEMVAVLERQGTEAHRAETLRRVLASPACHEEFELLRAVVRAAAVRPRRRLMPAWGWAAAVVAIVGAGWWLQVLQPADMLRGEPGGLIPVAPTGTIASPVPLFAWHPLPGAFRYDVAVVDTAGLARFSGSTTDTTLALPDSVNLAVGGVYRWWVRAVRHDGTAERSATVHFTIRP